MLRREFGIHPLTNANSESDVRDITAHPDTLRTYEESTLPEAKSEEQYVT